MKATTKATHTPGPWEIDQISDTTCDINSSASKYAAIAQLKANNLGARRISAEENTANARLVASAPQLLASLYECVEMLDLIAQEHGHSRSHHICAERARDIINTVNG